MSRFKEVLIGADRIEIDGVSTHVEAWNVEDTTQEKGWYQNQNISVIGKSTSVLIVIGDRNVLPINVTRQRAEQIANLLNASWQEWSRNPW